MILRKKRNVKKELIKSEREVLEKFAQEIRKEAKKKPPTIGVIGVSGVGKSSTINALFKTNLKVSHTVACTKTFEDVDLQVEVKDENMNHESFFLRIIDAPGLGEDLAKDPEYLEMYDRRLADCDVILWVMSARNRAVALDQQYLKILKRFSDNMIFGINQVDIVDPLDWDTAINLPSRKQEKNIKEIVTDRKEKIRSILKKEVSIFPYAASKGFELETLFTAILEACSEKRAPVFQIIKGFDFRQFIRTDFLKEIGKRG